MQIPLAQKSNGMYIFGSKDFDGIAELVLRQYAPYMFEEAQPLRIDELADEGYSLTILNYYLSAHGTVLGMITFGDTDVQVVNLEKKIVNERFMAGTIAIDARLLDDEHQHRRRFTAAHEVSHWIIHRQMYYTDGHKYNLRRANRFIACRASASNRDKRREYWSEEDWQEWQADRFASAMLMPASVFYPEAHAVMRRHHAGTYLLEGCGSKETGDVITELTEVFNVSRTAVRIRLKQAGILRSVSVIVCDD
jgi:hypothetical protein